VRIAVIACSPYSACRKLPELPNVETDVDILGQRLAEPDAGFVVHSFRAERGLAEAVEQVLTEATEPVDEFLFFFAGYAVVNDERGPALLLDGERLSAYSLKRLRRVLTERARSSLAVLDTVSAFDGQSNPKDAVQTIGAAIAEPGSRVHLFASSRPESEVDARSPFASLFELVLDWQSVSGVPVRAEAVYAAMRAEEAMFAEVRAAEYFAGAEPFELLRPFTPRWSDEPPSYTEQSSPQVPEPEMPSAERTSAPEAPVPASEPPPLPDDLTPPKPRVEALLEPTAPAEPRVLEPPPLEAPPLESPPPQAAPAEPAPAEPGQVLLPPPPAEPPPLTQAAKSVPPPLPKRAPKVVEPPTGPPTPEALRALALERLTECLADGRHADALTHARAALRFEPRDTSTYRTLNMLFEKLGRPDGCWNVACVLEACGAADVNESMLAGLHRPEGLIPAQGTLREADWLERRLFPDREPAVNALFWALGEASVRVGVETAQRKRRAQALDPTSEQDPAKSTTTLARTLLWSARLLALPTPKLYVVDEPGELTIAPTAEPVALASKSLGSGLSLPELAYLWARRLVLLRPEHRIVTFLTNAAELEDFMRAAQVFGAGSERAFKRLEGDTKLFGRGLKRHLRGFDRTQLEAAAKAIPRETLAESVTAFRRSIELTSGRAGLLACGDLALALRMTERFPQHGALALDEQRADLLTFSVSDEYAALRERLGVLVRA
jgi:hypothetical protein